jgi:hypothetical protein
MPLSSQMGRSSNGGAAVQSLLDPDLPSPFSSDQCFDQFLSSECDLVGAGSSRKVYKVRDRPFVVKVALDEAKRVCNWTEIAAFLHFCKDRPKLGEIFSWSASGHYLIMQELDMESHPDDSFVFPSWVSDRKTDNAGMAPDRTFKLCDYALMRSPDGSQKPAFE